MGTLFKQEKRSFNEVHEFDVKTLLKEVHKIGGQDDFEPDHVLKAFQILELRRLNDFLVNNGNTFDEQMHGIGKLLEAIATKANSIKNILAAKM